MAPRRVLSDVFYLLFPLPPNQLSYDLSAFMSISPSNKKCCKKMSCQTAVLIKKDFGLHFRGINQQQVQSITLDRSITFENMAGINRDVVNIRKNVLKRVFNVPTAPFFPKSITLVWESSD